MAKSIRKHIINRIIILGKISIAAYSQPKVPGKEIYRPFLWTIIKERKIIGATYIEFSPSKMRLYSGLLKFRIKIAHQQGIAAASQFVLFS
jgi:hypothetical protein